MSGGGRFCLVIRHIADHFWINTADYVTAKQNLPPISKSRLCRGKSRESETSPLSTTDVLLLISWPYIKLLNCNYTLRTIKSFT
jgi:hypothetical protein